MTTAAVWYPAPALPRHAARPVAAPRPVASTVALPPAGPLAWTDPTRPAPWSTGRRGWSRSVVVLVAGAVVSSGGLVLLGVAGGLGAALGS